MSTHLQTAVDDMLALTNQAGYARDIVTHLIDMSGTCHDGRQENYHQH